MRSEELNLESNKINKLDIVFKPGKPRKITFRSSMCRDEDNSERNVNISVLIEDGNVGGILNVVMEQGGIGSFDENGIYSTVVIC